MTIRPKTRRLGKRNNEETAAPSSSGVAQRIQSLVQSLHSILDQSVSPSIQRIRRIHLVIVLSLLLLYHELTNTASSQDGNENGLVRQVSRGFLRMTGSSLSGSVETKTPEATAAPASASASAPEQERTFESGCTPLQKSLIQKELPDAQTIIDATKCPDSSAWLDEYFADASDTEAFLFLDFGCNLGQHSLFIAETISGNTEIFNKVKWDQALGFQYTSVCATTNANVPATAKQRPVEVHCIEAMPQTAQKVIQAAQVTSAYTHGFHAYNYAMMGTPGGPPILFPNPPNSAGYEVLSIAHCNSPEWRAQCTEVPTKTLDEFVRDHVDAAADAKTSSSSKPNRRISFIHIDVEGYDFTVIKGAQETLQRTDYLEFEYHVRGDWGAQKLEDAINMLQKDFGFICYWSGINQLWKMTDNCWFDYFEFHMWSNVACVAPRYQPQLAARMEVVFVETLLQGKATTLP